MPMILPRVFWVTKGLSERSLDCHDHSLASVEKSAIHRGVAELRHFPYFGGGKLRPGYLQFI